MTALPGLSAHLKAFVLGVLLAAAGLGIYTWVSNAEPADASAAVSPAVPSANADTSVVTVYHSPTCGCCMKWVDHLRAEGFAVEVEARDDMGVVKQEHGVPRQLSACHTAVVDGYVVEGHVPAEDVAQLLRQRPEVAGIAVPGMPIGSPGMEQGDRQEPYDVVAFTRDGHASVFARHGR